MTIFLAVVIGGSILHAITNWITRTPDEDRIPYRWKLWHTFLAGLASTAVIVVVAVLIWFTTGVLVPYWSVLIAADILTIGWKIREHHKRTTERRQLNELLDRPAFGEAN